MQTLDFVSGLHTVSNSPNPSRVYSRLCEHRKCFLLLKYKCPQLKIYIGHSSYYYYLHGSKGPQRVYVSWMLWGLSRFWAHYWSLTKWKVSWYRFRSKSGHRFWLSMCGNAPVVNIFLTSQTQSKILILPRRLKKCISLKKGVWRKKYSATHKRENVIQELLI